MLTFVFLDLFDEIKVLFCLAMAGLSNRDNQISLPSFVNGNQFTQDTQFQRKKKMFPIFHESVNDSFNNISKSNIKRHDSETEKCSLPPSAWLGHSYKLPQIMQL